MRISSHQLPKRLAVYDDGAGAAAVVEVVDVERDADVAVDGGSLRSGLTSQSFQLLAQGKPVQPVGFSLVFFFLAQGGVYRGFVARLSSGQESASRQEVIAPSSETPDNLDQQ